MKKQDLFILILVVASITSLVMLGFEEMDKSVDNYCKNPHEELVELCKSDK